MSKSVSAFSSTDLASLVKAIEALAAQQATNNKVVTALLERLSAAPVAAGKRASVASAADEAPVKGKRGRKPKTDKAPKVKAAPPAAEDGVIRFGAASDGDYKEFSNFYKSPFVVDDKEYISVANYFHSMKFATADDEYAEEIRIQKNPALTRAKASSVKEHTPREDWAETKLEIMRSALVAKFSANAALLRKLLDTGDAPLESTIEEEMRVKGFWSIGEDGSGENQTGLLLMSVRDQLRDGAPVASKPAAVGGAGAKASKKPAALPKKVAPPPADSDSDSDDSDNEEAPAAKPAPVAKKPSAPAKKPVPAAAADSDSDESGDEEAPAAKPAPVAKKPAAPAKKPAPPAPVAPVTAEDSDSESESESED